MNQAIQLIRVTGSPWVAPVNLVGQGARRISFKIVSTVAISLSIRTVGSDINGSPITLSELVAFDYLPSQGIITVPQVDAGDVGNFFPPALVALTDLPVGSVTTVWYEFE